MLVNPTLLDTIREEVANAFNNDTLDMTALDQTCPRLQGLWLEVLRLTVSSSSVRYVTKPTYIGGKRFESGNMVVNSCRQLHFNESIFGPNPGDFDADRFLARPNLHRSSSWKPFGGGISLCPGQYVAKRASCMFIALVLRRFEVKLAFLQKFPKAKDKNPDLGIFVPETDLVLDVRPRLI